VDTKERKVKAKAITFHRKKNLPISIYVPALTSTSKNLSFASSAILLGMNSLLPSFIHFIDLTNARCSDPALELTEGIAYAPKELDLDPEHIAEMNRATQLVRFPSLLSPFLKIVL
jgi:hypothetical protein